MSWLATAVIKCLLFDQTHAGRLQFKSQDLETFPHFIDKL